MDMTRQVKLPSERRRRGPETEFSRRLTGICDQLGWGVSDLSRHAGVHMAQAHRWLTSTVYVSAGSLERLLSLFAEHGQSIRREYLMPEEG